MDVSFDELFDDVYPGLYRYCLRLTADSDVAEDIAQETFVRLLDRRVLGDPRGLRAWLYKVATHLVRDRIRVRGNRARLLERSPPPASPAETADVALERAERIEGVRSALARLDPRDRELLLMREEGFSYRELAAAVGVEASSVGTLLARARRKFTDALDHGVKKGHERGLAR